MQAVSDHLGYWPSRLVHKPRTIIPSFDLDGWQSSDSNLQCATGANRCRRTTGSQSLLCSSELPLRFHEDLAPAVISSPAHCRGASIGGHRVMGVGWKLITGPNTSCGADSLSQKPNCGGSEDRPGLPRVTSMLLVFVVPSAAIDPRE